MKATTTVFELFGDPKLNHISLKLIHGTLKHRCKIFPATKNTNQYSEVEGDQNR
jgi:hypothetical protein